MGCLNIKQSAPEVRPKFHIEKQTLKGEEKCFFRDHFRVYYVTKGYVTVSYGNGEGMRLGCGDICIIPPNANYSARGNTTLAELYVFTFSINFIEHILQHQAGSGGRLSSLFNSGNPVVIAPVPAEMQIHLQNLMDFMRHEYEMGIGNSELVLRNCLATVFCVFLELLKADESVKSPTDKNSILYAINYVKKNFDKKISAGDLAKTVRMSKKEFLSRFTAFSGRSFHDFLNKTRIETAVEIYRKSKGDISFSELSSICGYDNYITFYRNFIKYTGVSPAEF